MRIRALILVLTLTLAGCGSQNDAPKPIVTNSSRAHVKTNEPPTRTTSCAESTVPAAPRGGASGDAWKQVVDATTRHGHRFTTWISITTASGLTARGVLDGRRKPGGSSTATLDWKGLAGALLEDRELRIVDNQIASRTAGGAWQNLGSASGIALDVGRELLTHPFLLHAQTRELPNGTTLLTAVAPADELRAYATDERQGIATELLRGTRSLRIATLLDDDRILADRFVLVTTPPARFAKQLGTGPLTVRAATTYC